MRENQKKQNHPALLQTTGSRLSTLKTQSSLSGEQYMHATHFYSEAKRDGR